MILRGSRLEIWHGVGLRAGEDASRHWRDHVTIDHAHIIHMYKTLSAENK